MKQIFLKVYQNGKTSTNASVINFDREHKSGEIVIDYSLTDYVGWEKQLDLIFADGTTAFVTGNGETLTVPLLESYLKKGSMTVQPVAKRLVGGEVEKAKWQVVALSVRDSLNVLENDVTVTVSIAEQMQAEIDEFKDAEAMRVQNEIDRESSEGIRESSEVTRGQNESIRESNENTRISNEQARVIAEPLRITAEQGRVIAEDVRVGSEQGRVTAEGLRVSAEQGRASAESTRVMQETGRVNAEAMRVQNEIDRESSEGIRESSEVTRGQNESTRQSNEVVRVNNESGRVSAESSRVTAEQGRASAESTRVMQETGRVNAEAMRESSELLRIENEIARNTFVPYSGSTAYQAGNKVSYLGSSYVAKSNTTGNLPTNTTYWLLIAQKGDNTTANDVTFTPTGNISSTNVQNALAELDTDKASKTEVYSLLNQDRRIFGVSWNGGSNPTLTRTGYAVGLTANIGIDNQVVVNDFDNLPIWRWDDVIDNLGNVFKRIPKFYIRKTAIGDARTWEVSQYKGDGFYLPWCFWDFVKNKELDYVDVGKYQASLDGTNKLESKPLKYPLVNTHIVNFRTYARANGAGYGQFDIHVTDLLQTLFIIEFATLNSQSVMPGFTNGQYSATRLAVLTETAVNRVVLANANANVFRVGQPISIGTTQGGNQVFYGRTITAINVVDASNKELVFDGDPVNITAGNMVYNTGWRSGWSSAVLAKSGTIIANDGFYPMMYRGIESLYGDVIKWVDGVNIYERQALVCENQDNYVSNLFTAPYKMLSYLNKNASGYPSKMGIDFANPYANFPVETSDGTTFYSDYYYQAAGARVVLLGGSWFDGAYAGLFYWNLGYASSNVSIGVGGRLIRKAV